jgi:hypothetical protein
MRLIKTTGVGLVLLSSLILIAGAAVAQTSEDDSATSGAAFTNADLDKLPAPGNEQLPSLETPAGPTTLPPAPPSAEAPEVAPSPAAAATDKQSAEWLEKTLESMKLDRAIAEAQRKIREASNELARLQGRMRPEGSAFPQNSEVVEGMYMRDVASDKNRHAVLVQRALDKRAAARLELDRLLAQPR